jgi:hypothetical protein
MRKAEVFPARKSTFSKGKIIPGKKSFYSFISQDSHAAGDRDHQRNIDR